MSVVGDEHSKRRKDTWRDRDQDLRNRAGFREEGCVQGPRTAEGDERQLPRVMATRDRL